MKKLFSFAALSIAALAARGQTVTATVTTTPCHADGVLMATASGLTPPLTFTYYEGVGTVTHTGVLTMTDNLTAYAGEAVDVEVTDGTGFAYTYFTGAPPFTYTVTNTPATCPTLSSATIAVTGGTSPYTYQWYTIPGGTLASTTNPASLPDGQYNVMITDAAGCNYGSLYTPDSIYIYSLPAFSYSVTTTDANCTNGTASVGTISGGTAPYSYSWSTLATTSAITSLTTGYYYVNVTDASGCSVNNYAYVNQAIAITASITPTPATCMATDGAVIAFGAGGMPPYSYLWSNGATTQSQTGLASGSYSVHVTDANGCVGDGYTYVSASTPITVTYTSTPSSCTSATGTATVAISGGTTPYTTNWYSYPPQTGVTATSLAPGNYSFHITDAAGCVQSGTVNVPPIDMMSLGLSSTSATCTLANGSASVSVSGGATPLTYLWNTGGTASSLSSIASGYYSVTVTDVNGCTASGYTDVGIYSPVGVALATTPASCIFSSDGSIAASVWGGTSPYSYSWSTGGTGSSIGSLGAGYYSVYVTDATGCSRSSYAYLSADPSGTACYCTISGTVYYDINGNCVQDAGEPGISGIQMHCSGMGYTYTDASGHYSFIVPTGSYTVSETVLAYYPLSACQVNNIPVSVTASAGCTTAVDFANSMATIHDIHVSTWDYNFPVPGNSYSQAVIVKNMGTVSESAILAGYNTDGQLGMPSFAPSGIFAGTGDWYNTAAGFTTLAPGGAQPFIASYGVPTDIPMSTSVVFKDSAAYMAPISNWLTDYSPWNNVNYFTTTVVSSYDPNFKEVSPKGTGAAGYISTNDSVLEYMVHFQNTGTYYAENITVKDTLDPNLDWTTLKPIFSSANCTVDLSENGVATFTFHDINLPPSSMSAMNSNGMFTYTVRQRPGLTEGTQIRNKASIYFDYNEPIVTNSTLNTIGSPVAVAGIEGPESSFNLYPNPAGSTCYITINSVAAGEADLRITDITGKMVRDIKMNLLQGKQTSQIDVSALSSGIYFVTLSNGGKVETHKLSIIR